MEWLKKYQIFECYWIILSLTKIMYWQVRMSRMNQYLYSLIHGIGMHALLILSSMSKWSLSIIWMEEAVSVKQQARVGKML
jgi:hypothetical protein